MLERPNEAPAVAAVAGLMASPPGFSHHTRNRSAIGSRCRQVPQQEPAGGAGIGIIRLCTQAVQHAFENFPAFLGQSR